MNYRFRSLAEVERHLASKTDYEKMARFANLERAFNLDRTRNLLSALGDPQNRVEAVHVAGTKGKGSVCHMISAVLDAAGVRTGLFTSPHLVSPIERVRVAGRPVQTGEFCSGMERVASAADECAGPGEESPTFFERIFALSCLLFAELGVRAAVFEVGLGGRLDATNVLEPAACAITTLALDHTHVLGTTLKAIALEKAGILKKGVPAVVAQSAPEAMDVVLESAKRAGAPLLVLGRDIRVVARKRTDGGFGIEVDVETPFGRFEGLRVPLAGLHQGANVGVVAGVLDILARERGFPVGDSALRRGLLRSRVPGRIEKILEEPALIVDVAHNETAMRASLEAIEAFFPHRRLFAVAGFSKDKDYRAALKPLVSMAACLILTSAGGIRAADPRDLAEAAGDAGARDVVVTEDVGSALEVLRLKCDVADLGLVTGSFYVAGKAFKHLGVEVG